MALGVADESWMQAAGQLPSASVAVRFEVLAREDEAATLEKGCPQFRDVEYIEKRVPGDRGNVVHRPITAEDRKEFAVQYEAWKKGLADPTAGSPLKEWPLLTRSQVEVFALNGVKTVEQLAEMSDGNTQMMGAGVLALRSKARDWLEKAKAGSLDLKLRAELDKRDSQIAALQEQLKSVCERAEELEKHSKRK